MGLSDPLQQVERTYVRYRGRKLSYFAGCDYFRLASHPTVLAAIAQGMVRYGLNVAASRSTTGNHLAFGRLEKRIADFFGVEAATLTSNGYVSNLVACQALAGEFTHAILDERAHISLVDAAVFLDCPRLRFKHRDAGELSRVLKRLGRVKPLVLTDGMFSHDGGIAPLKEYVSSLPPEGMILVDDAHGAGVLGREGRGTPEQTGVSRQRLIQTITLSKAFGVYGGAVLGGAKLREQIINRSRLFVGNTPLPLPLAHAATLSIGRLQRTAGLRRRLRKNTALVKTALNQAGFNLGDNPSPIIPVIPEGSAQADRLYAQLLKAGIYPSFIRYPGGPANGYFRFVLSSEHTQKQLQELVQVLTGFAAWK